MYVSLTLIGGWAADSLGKGNPAIRGQWGIEIAGLPLSGLSREAQEGRALDAAGFRSEGREGRLLIKGKAPV